MSRPPKYKTAEEMQKSIDEYFLKCEASEKPLTVTGLALHLGFTSRQALLNYQGKKAFVDTVMRAKLRIESYAEERLYDRDGCRGAMFSLERNFRNWIPENDANTDVLGKLDEVLNSIDKEAKK